jgi:uncharacterized protein (DUF1501 family)
MQRRAFIKNSGMAVFAATLGGIPTFVRAAAQDYRTPAGARPRVLVTIFQRGAMDGLAAVQPLNDPYLKELRPGLILEAARTGNDKLRALDDRFGLHPSLAPLLPLYRDGRLAIVHGVGSPNQSRSHFDAQDYMEAGTPGRKSTPDGWLNRVADQLEGKATPFRAVSLTPALPRSLYGKSYALSVERLEDLRLAPGMPTTLGTTVASEGFEALYRQTSADLLRSSGSVTLDATQMLAEAELDSYQSARGVRYPNSALGRSLRQIAQLIKAGVGLEIAFAESGGWDTHARQGGAFGGFTQRANDLSTCISNFWRDIAAHQDEVCLLTMTEFGRTVRQNGAFGTDHGRGSCLFVLGNEVRGGKIYGEVPPLKTSNLEDGRDLPVTTDFRAVFSGVATGHLGVRGGARLFPGWTGKDLQLM